MKVVGIISFWFVVLIVIVMAAALLSGIFWRLFNNPRQQFITRARKNFETHFPLLYSLAYEPRITLQSKCCKTFMWQAENSGKHYFCDKCGDECDRKGRKKEKGLNLKVMAEQLSDMAQNKSG
jgi:hypothetical protein